MSGRGPGCPARWPGCPARRIQISFGAEIFELGAEMDDSKGKIGEILWMEMGKSEDMLDPLETKQIYGSNPTKLSQPNNSQKNWGYFWWGFSKLGKNTTKLG